MEKSYSESYAAAGVDITAGYRSVELMKQYVARTMNEHCIGGLGGFGGLFELDCTGYKHPVLISGTDGVGTKLKIAMIMDKHDTIGIDCVAMCVNDVICAGAKPLVFLDYIACGRNIPEKIAEIVKGVAEGCVQADCSLVGGETAEHPGMMPEDEYDLAGFTVGVVDKEKILNNETMKPGDVIIALPSTGVHTPACGDAHIGNIGFYRSPEGNQVIDLNDFDEAHTGCWEWDLRRLTASIWVLGRVNGASEQDCADAVAHCVVAYRDEVSFLSKQPLLWRAFDRLDVEGLHSSVTEEGLREEIERAAVAARRRTSDRKLPKLTGGATTAAHILDDPPLVTHPDPDEYEALADGLDAYLTTLTPQWRRIVGGYTLVDIAHKVVGVGSVGLRAWVALLCGSREDDVLFLQLKQAQRSVLAPFVHGEHAWHEHQGQRVVEYQQVLQTVSDPLLGWTTVGPHQYYVRQYRNMKGGIPLDNMSPSALVDYSGVTGHLLAKGHARTSGASIISGYLGKRESAVDAFVAWARSYADQTEADHADLVAAIASGRLPAEPGV